MASCAPPSALGCLSLAGGSYSWMGCYQSIPLVGAVQLAGTYGSATQCITGCSIAGAGYVYASIAGGSCYCGDSSSSPTTSPSSASTCNLLCSGDNALCGGYDGSSIYSEVFKYIAGGSSSCPALTSSTSTKISTSTTTTSSVASPTGTSCDYLVNGQFESGGLAPWTTDFPNEVAIVKAPVPGVPAVTPFPPSSYVLQASLVGGENFTVQQTVPVCPLVNYAPKISYQLAVDPSGGKKGPLTCTYQFCELVSGVCGRLGTMRAGRWGSNTPQWLTKATQTTAIVQVNFRCPVPAVAYLGQLEMNPFQHG